MIEILKIIFPMLMIIGALGSFIIQIISEGWDATCLQWFGATLLYTALLMRNIKK